MAARRPLWVPRSGASAAQPPADPWGPAARRLGFGGGASPGAGAAGDPRAVVISEPACGPWRVRGVVARAPFFRPRPAPPAAGSLGDRGRKGRGPQVPGDVIQPARLQGAKGPLIWQSLAPPWRAWGHKGRTSRPPPPPGRPPLPGQRSWPAEQEKEQSFQSAYRKLWPILEKLLMGLEIQDGDD
ncbi:PREDICTED: collagen alpha-2(IV) chain-like [Rhinopithecus bieti]|uniref:collagen alpha-2(IV) chain-like n=1 Tax=Rhinopithecus bieti TaxID=61621 RepID=UPI00083BB661|nr:PREDICTED: collagen alpha-2(IV) chain-like [Rhinopithecus bieti]